MRVPGRSSRRTASAVAIIAALAIPWTRVVEAQADSDKHKRSTFVALVGHWTALNHDSSEFQVDGERWNGATTHADLETAARPLFPNLGATFLANGTAPNAFPLAVWREVRDFAQGTVRVQFKLLGGRSDQTAGIVIGLQATGEYLFVRYNTKDGNVAIWAYADGQRQVLAHGSTHKQLPLNAWHELSVTVTGLKVTGAVNGASLTVEHTLDRPVSGRVGVWTKRDAVTVFRGFVVTQ